MNSTQARKCGDVCWCLHCDICGPTHYTMPHWCVGNCVLSSIFMYLGHVESGCPYGHKAEC